VRDADAAQDLEQETWLAALERPPRTAESPRGWLATVVRNAARQVARTGARRADREERAGRPESLPSGAEIAERTELCRLVAERVTRLPEPYRTAIHLRFFEGLGPGEIARRAGLPVETVRTRVKRGLATLRGDLDRAFGGERRAWCAALAPIAGLGAGLGAGPGFESAGGATGGATGGTTGGTSLWTGIATMTLTTKLTVAGGCAVALLAFLLTRSGGDEPEPAPEPPAVASADEPPPAPRASAPEPTRRAAIDAPPAAAPAVAAPAEDPDAASWTGSVVVVADDGRLHERPSGSFRAARVPGAGRARTVPVEVVDGRFAFTAPDARDFRVEELVLDGRVAWATEERYSHPTGDPAHPAEVAIVARFVPATRLRVRDEATGFELSDVRVVEGVLKTKRRVHPGALPAGSVCVDGAASPVALPARDGVRGYWVHAPGYAWGHVEVDHRSGGEREVWLRTGGALVVHVPPLDPSFDLVVRLSPPDTPDSRFGAGNRRPVDGVARFDGLPPAGYEVRAEIGIWSDPPLRLGARNVRVLAGETTGVELAVEAALLPGPPVSLGGTLRLPAGHEDLDAYLTNRRVGGPQLRETDRFSVAFADMRRSADDPGLLHWEAGAVSPGEYLLVVQELQLAWRIEVPPVARHEEHVELPPLGEVVVRVRDAATGAPILLDGLAWSRARPDGVVMWSLASVSREPGETDLRFAAPVGPISVHVESTDHARDPYVPSVTVGPGTSTLTVELEPLEALLLTLRDGEAVVPVRWGMHLSVEEVGGDGTGSLRSNAGGVAKVLVSRPGTYRVDLVPPDGFAPVEPFEVQVFAGGVPTAVDVPLERRP